MTKYVCARCGMKRNNPVAGKCPGTSLPHEWIRAGKRYACRYCGTKRNNPAKGICPARRGTEDPYHIFMVIE